MNWDQLRHKIDAGETGEKVGWSDPTVAPLGTDEEAGGAWTAPEDIAAWASRERRPDAAYASPGRAVVVLGVASLLAVVVTLLVWASSTSP